jgi:hypothetical protein
MERNRGVNFLFLGFTKLEENDKSLRYGYPYNYKSP